MQDDNRNIETIIKSYMDPPIDESINYKRPKNKTENYTFFVKREIIPHYYIFISLKIFDNLGNKISHKIQLSKNRNDEILFPYSSQNSEYFNNNYNLIGIVAHVGNTIVVGHYISLLSNMIMIGIDMMMK